MSENGMSTGEMSIREAWGVLARHRVSAMVSFLVVVLAAGVFLMRAKPVYEVEGSFYVGRFGATPVEAPTLVIQRLEATFRKGGAIPGASLTAVTPDRRDARLIRFTARGTTPDPVQRLAEGVVANVLEFHNKRIEEESEALGSELKELRMLAEEGRSALNRLKAQARSGADVPVAVMSAAVELAAIHTRVGELERELRNGFEPTKLVVRPVVAPVSPNRGLIVILALVGGLFAAMVTPFFVEAVARLRKA